MKIGKIDFAGVLNKTEYLLQPWELMKVQMMGQKSDLVSETWSAILNRD